MGALEEGPAEQPEQQLDPEAHERRQQDQQHRERDDVEARGAARREELRVVPEQVEERLGDGEGPEDGEVREMPERLPDEAGPLLRLGRAVRGHQPFGRAWYRTRVPDSRRSERSTSNDSSRQPSKKPSS